MTKFWEWISRVYLLNFNITRLHDVTFKPKQYKFIGMVVVMQYAHQSVSKKSLILSSNSSQ